MATSQKLVCYDQFATLMEQIQEYEEAQRLLHVSQRLSDSETPPRPGQLQIAQQLEEQALLTYKGLTVILALRLARQTEARARPRDCLCQE